jgi:hypothetical protein
VDPDRELTIPAGTLGRIEKRAGFRQDPLWLVEIVPHSAPLSFSSQIRSLPNAFRRHHALQRKFVLASSEIVEINHFMDKYSVEWTRFGDDSDEARKREFAGTTILPGIYSPAEPDLDENLDDAQQARIEDAIQRAAMHLVLTVKDRRPFGNGSVLVLDAESPPGLASPHFFHNQCFVPEDQFLQAPASAAFRVAEASLAIFEPAHAPQVPKAYYAVDLALQLNSGTGKSIPVVCRFPSAPIEVNLLDNAERILSTFFSFASSTR